ncbi:MAG: SMC-Scp complex subunit ScpB, partial [Nitrospirales bacterium]
MLKDSPENGLLIQEVPEGMEVTKEMGLCPDQNGVVTDLPVSDNPPAGVLDEGQLKGVLEALLYVSHEPLILDKLTMVIGGTPKLVVHNAMRALQQDYDQEGRGLRIAEVAGGYIMVTRPDCAPWITRLQKVKASSKVSRSALETLAMIAYKQPIVRAEIEQIRGVESAGVLRTLLDQKLIRIVGRKDLPGRPMMYGTSRIFLQRFGLRDLRDLP